MSYKALKTLAAGVAVYTAFEIDSRIGGGYATTLVGSILGGLLSTSQSVQRVESHIKEAAGDAALGRTSPREPLETIVLA